MAFQTNVLRDGEWVTEFIDLQAVLRANSAPRPQRQRLARSPECGLLSRTVIDSPIVHQILPVRLRAENHVDVAFVGDRFVDIYELQKDGQLKKIIRKSDFGCRIRNAAVLGSIRRRHEDDDEDGFLAKAKVEDGDTPMDDFDGAGSRYGHGAFRLPPQLLLLVLETGDCVFLMLRQHADGGMRFVTSRFPAPSGNLAYPGFHLAVDPSSRYMALACARRFFVVYELESGENLSMQVARNEPLRPVKSHRPRAVQGVIHKIEFLHPRPEDDYHIILLLIVVKDDVSRMITYEWEAGDDLKSVLAEEKDGHRLPEEHQMPLLLIPLTVRTAFLAISTKSIAVCKDILQGDPSFDDFPIQNHETSEFHHGRSDPIWTAWTRPYRESWYLTSHDHIYLAREDGVVSFLDIDSDNILGSTVKIIKSNCNISTAFCSLFDDFADILIMGSNSGAGAIWQLFAREAPRRIGMLPNWSPSVDVLTTDEFSKWNQVVGAKGNRLVSWKQHRYDSSFAPSARIFTASGNGVTGTVAELRHGIAANIGLDIEYESPIRQCWIFPTDIATGSSGFDVLLSLPYRSVVLHFSADLADADEPEPTQVPYDLSSRTVCAAQISSDTIAQATESRVVLVRSGSQSVTHMYTDLFGEPDISVIHVSIGDGLVALAAHSHGQYHVRLLRLVDESRMATVQTHVTDADVTALSLVQGVSGNPCLVIGTWKNMCPSLLFLPSDATKENTIRSIDVNQGFIESLSRAAGYGDGDFPREVEEFVSILGHARDGSDGMTVTAGTRNGQVLTLALSATGEPQALSCERFGLTAAHISHLDDSALPGSVLVCCDTRVTLMHDLDARRGRFKTKHYVWPVDAGDPTKPSVPVTSLTVARPNLSGPDGGTHVLFAAGSRFLIAELQHQAGPVPRTIPVGATPQKLLYSHTLDCLVVALKISGERGAVKFMDPDTGQDLSRPSDSKTGELIETIPGLDKPGDVINDLTEWVFEKEGKKWVFIIVATKPGRLLILSVAPRDAGSDGRRGEIHFWLKYKKHISAEIHTVLGDGQNVVYCAGSTLYLESLDVVARKLELIRTIELNSPARTLSVVNGKFVALTLRNSIEIVDPKAQGQAEEQAGPGHADPTARQSVHFIEVGGPSEDAKSAMLLLCDRACGIAGLWIPWRQPGKDCEVIFEAEVPSSVQKLRRGTTRPLWQRARRRPRYGLVPSTQDAADILGICLDGSLQHFMLLSMEIWRIFSLVQNLAIASPLLYPYTYEEVDEDFDPGPEADRSFQMQIDGDTLQRCLDQRALETLFALPQYVARLKDFLDGLEGGKWTAALKTVTDPNEQRHAYFDLVYDIIEYYLEPVM